MRLVGATDGFVRLPFLLEGAFAGLLGGILALILTSLAFNLFNGAAIFSISWLPGEWLVLAVVGAVAYGVVASGIAVRQHLRSI